MATVDVNHLHFSSDEKGIVHEKKIREVILQRLKEQEASLWLLYSHLKKQIADLEAKHKALTRPTLALEIKIQRSNSAYAKSFFWLPSRCSVSGDSICTKSLVSTVEKKILMQYS
ncbi:hypothetical protein DUI87_09757 [Hirundo rustica rustica]|uniref:Uncharacterized protein n=1 Tax=Hirundo rustica rustica TaxID=333673 RepID=A0A3M0KGJ3_HIRRU|nr:hypothetical protein DUI87_09757 [Hirundo rustica rustica]